MEVNPLLVRCYGAGGLVKSAQNPKGWVDLVRGLVKASPQLLPKAYQWGRNYLAPYGRSMIEAGKTVGRTVGSTVSAVRKHPILSLTVGGSLLAPPLVQSFYSSPSPSPSQSDSSGQAGAGFSQPAQSGSAGSNHPSPGFGWSDIGQLALAAVPAGLSLLSMFQSGSGGRSGGGAFGGDSGSVEGFPGPLVGSAARFQTEISPWHFLPAGLSLLFQYGPTLWQWFSQNWPGPSSSSDAGNNSSGSPQGTQSGGVNPAAGGSPQAASAVPSGAAVTQSQSAAGGSRSSAVASLSKPLLTWGSNVALYKSPFLASTKFWPRIGWIGALVNAGSDVWEATGLSPWQWGRPGWNLEQVLSSAAHDPYAPAWWNWGGSALNFFDTFGSPKHLTALGYGFFDAGQSAGSALRTSRDIDAEVERVRRSAELARRRGISVPQPLSQWRGQVPLGEWWRRYWRAFRESL